MSKSFYMAYQFIWLYGYIHNNYDVSHVIRMCVCMLDIHCVHLDLR